MKGTLYITGDPAADKLLNTDPLALVLGMMLDQQVRERRGPASTASDRWATWSHRASPGDSLRGRSESDDFQPLSE